MSKNIDWCKDTIPALYTLNKMIVARKGNIPVKAVLFVGDKADIDFVVKKEGELLNGIRYKNVDVNKNHIVINIPSGIAKFNYSSFVALLRFDDVSVLDTLDNAISKALQDAIKTNTNAIASKVLFKHFENFDDNILHIEDLSCLDLDVVDNPILKVNNTKPMAEPTKTNVNEVRVQASSIAAPKLEDIITETPALEVNNVSISESVSAETEAVTTSDNSLSNVPEPEDTAVGQDLPYQIKDELTEEEQAHNKALLDEIRVKYNKTIKYIQELHNGSYQIILNTMKECNERSKYDKQFTLLYMDISDNFKTELYKRLYDLDNYTKSFNEKLIHQVVELGCPYCGSRWKEDITFVPSGQQFIQCPNCSEERPYNKQ